MTDGILDALRAADVARGAPVALTISPGIGAGIAPAKAAPVAFATADPCALVDEIERALRPRWTVWSIDTAHLLVADGVRVATSWDLAAVHRLMFGGWRADPSFVWARIHDLAVDAIPSDEPLDLFNQVDQLGGDAEEPVRDDGYLRPDWADGAWSKSPARLARWAGLAAEVAQLQQARLMQLTDRPSAMLTARSESTAELLCAELAADGLPLDREAAEHIVAGYIGPRPRDEADEAAQRRRRDDEVLQHVARSDDIDLRSPGQVKSLLRRAGIEVADTRAWRLRSMRDEHPVVDALLAWRKAERVATTYGYAWLDEHLDGDGRLRGGWSASDGAAGRMTASAGLHNMPADMRAAVVAEPGHVLVRADLGQIEPRVLASVSGDRALALATLEDDMYAPVARDLGVDRPTAKVAVLGAMYGQTTGNGAQVLGRLEAAYPVAMGYLRDADRAGQGARAVRTYGGRLITFWSTNANEISERDARRIAAGRGRYGRNAMVQGAAAELFKVWAVTTRARGHDLGAHIVLCLHDELLLHVPTARADDAAQLLVDCLDEAVHRWAPDDAVRFVADVAIVDRWSEAKG